MFVNRPLPSPVTSLPLLKAFAMGLFKPDLFRSFILGFGATAMVMAAQIVPQLV